MTMDRSRRKGCSGRIRPYEQGTSRSCWVREVRTATSGDKIREADQSLRIIYKHLLSFKGSSIPELSNFSVFL